MAKKYKSKETFTTGYGEIKAMFAAKPVQDKHSKENEYLIRLEFDGTCPLAMKLKKHISGINAKKIVTKNADGESIVKKEGNFIMKFNTGYQPVVMDSNGQILQGKEIPFFNSKNDSGTAAVLYDIITYENGTQITKLSGIKLGKDLQIVRQESSEGTSNVLDNIKAKLNNL